MSANQRQMRLGAFFNPTGHHVASLDDFVELVLPELQRRGLFRTVYEGHTLREHLGLPRPASRYARAPASSAVPVA